jgi:N-acetylglucosamine malate deacetylase 1
MFNHFKTVFVLAPHTDDGELGCGGTIKMLVDNGLDVYYIAFSTAEESVPEGFPKNQLEVEVKNATEELGIQKNNLILYRFPVRKLNFARQNILENLIKLRERYNPDLIFMPSLNDIHQDHEVVAQEGLRAFKNRTLLGYELIWNNLKFNTDCFISLDKKHIDAKVKALAKYKTQEGRTYMSHEFIFALAKTRGVQIGVKFAETFEVTRWIIK